MLHQMLASSLLLVITRFAITPAGVLTRVASGTLPLDASFARLNLTKKPLNLYITENGKHATVVAKRWTLIGEGEKAAEPATVDYRIAQPPFAIKRRGSVVLLHNSTGDSSSWHHGRPSLLQMLAASGHTTVAVDLPRATSASDIQKRLRQIVVDAEPLTNLTFVTADAHSADVVDALLAAEPLAVALKVDGLILVERKETAGKRRDDRRTPSIIVELDGGKTTATKSVVDDNDVSTPTLKRVRLSDAPVVGSATEEQKDRERLMQIFVNFLEFIHPR